MADLLQTADRCRLERIAQIDHLLPGMRENLKRAEDTVRTCPAEITKLEAEKRELEALTPEAAVREMLPEGDRKLLAFRCGACKKTWAFPESLRFCPECRTKLEAVAAEAPAKPTEEPFVPGLPPEELRKVWAEWEMADGVVYVFQGNKYRCTYRPATEWWDIGDGHTWHASYRPHGKTRAEVEAMADAAEKPDEPKQPAPPALLDLRTVRMDSEHAEPDTLIANADLYDTGRNPTEHHASVKKGEKFTVERAAADHGQGPRVKVLLDGGSGVFIAAMQPAHVVPRVVKHACPRCDEGMREIIIEWDQDSVQTATRLGADGTAIVEIGSESTIYTPNAYRFVRADVPPPSEWCDGKGAQ